MLTPVDALRWIRRLFSLTPFQPVCLEESLVLQRVLRTLGYQSMLKIGVGRTHTFAHAWVEVDGAPVNSPASIGIHYHVLAGKGHRDAG